jgi:hypothetical protein
MKHGVVIESPTLPEGALIDMDRAPNSQLDGTIILPVNPDMIVRSGIGGYTKRSFGGGYPLPIGIPTHISPITIFVDSNASSIHWAIKLRKLTKNEPATGRLQFTADTKQLCNSSAAITYNGSPATSLESLQEEDGSWLMRGEARLNIAAVPGYLGFGIYGSGQNIAVAWLAASIV